MKERISALMDGELERRESAGALEAIKAGSEARDLWRTYHLIGDAMRDTRTLSAGFSGRVSAQLEDEPTVLAPARLAVRPVAMRWSALAAGLAAAAFVGWMAFTPQEGGPPLAPVAKSTPAAPAAQEAALVAPPAAALVPPPASADDYLLAHQRYSPRNSLQGVAPYVRTVSGETGAQRR